MNGLVDVNGYKICIQVCMWLSFPALHVYMKYDIWYLVNYL